MRIVTAGNKSTFAIESQISYLSKDLSITSALGYFVIYINDHMYGVKSDDATMLSCSFDEVSNRVCDKDRHLAPFSYSATPIDIATAYLSTFYWEHPDVQPELNKLVETFKLYNENNKLTWAPDGDAAFDDGSFVLQFDYADKVRLIAFKNTEQYENTINEIWIPIDMFYEILVEWRDCFATYLSMPA